MATARSRTSGIPTALQPLVSRYGIRKPALVRNMASNYAGTIAADGNGYAQCIAIPGKFDSIRLGFVHSGGGVATGLAAAIAATDYVGDRSNTNTAAGRAFVVPWRGGVEKNEYSADGWTRVTVGGATTWDIADPGTTSQIAIAWSDLMECHGIEDSTYPGMYPLLIRFSPGSATFTRSGLSGFADPAKFLAEAGENYAMGCFRVGASTAVATIGNWTSGSNVTFSDAAVLPIIIEAYVGGRAARTFMMVGDSRFALPEPGAEETNNGYRSLTWKLENALRSIGVRAVSGRCARGAQTTLTYSTWASQYLAQLQPDASIYLAYSINDGTPTEALLATARTRTLAHIELCRSKGVSPLIVSIFPYSTAMPNLAAVRAFDTWCASLGVPCFSPLQVYGDTAGGWVSGNADANHMTSAGYSDLANRLAAWAAASLA